MMKNLLLSKKIGVFLIVGIILLVGMNKLAYGQTTLYSENFGITTSFPSGWITGGNVDWVGSTNGGTTYTGASGSGSMLHSNTVGEGTLTYCNNLSTVGYGNITVIWGAARRDPNTSSFYYSIDNGGTWTQVTFTDVPANNNLSTWALVNGGVRINLPSNAAGVSNLCFQWRHTIINSGTYIAYRLDDFSVQGNSPGDLITENFSYTGSSQTFTVPNCVTSLTVEAWGGGGAGGGATGNPSAGGGGAGGSYVKNTSITVSQAGNPYTVSVGSGATGNAGVGTSGGDSWFSTTSTLLAKGGPGGDLATSNSQTAAGATAISTGNVGATAPFNYYGGGGGTGGTLGSSGGGGGGGAGTSSNGNAGNGINGGTAVTGGGAGINGSTTGADGTDNTNLGGGGAGGHTDSKTNRAGGSGGNGAIKITYTLPDNPTISLSSTSTSTCYSASVQNATIAYTATSGCPDKYSIDFTSGISDVIDASLSASPITIPILAGLAAGEYSGILTVKNSSYGFVSSNYTVTVTIIANSTAPTNAVASPSSVCSGVATNITLTASGGTMGTGAVVQWYTGSCGETLVGTGNPLNISQTLLSATTYYARYSGDCNETSCVASSQVTVNALPATPTITPSGSISFCTGGSVTLTSSSGAGYQWSTGATTQDINVISPGSYSVQVTDAMGCQSAASAATDVTVNALPIVSNTGNSSLCIGETTQLSPSSGGSWTSNNTSVATVLTYSGLVTGVSSGSTTFTFTSDYPVCSATTSEVTVLATPTSVTVNGTGTFCGNTTITALGGTGGTIFFQGTTSGGTSTTNASTSETITASGTYYFRSKSSTDCWGPEGSAVVIINPLPVVSITGNSTIGINETVQLSPSSGGSWVSNNTSVATVLSYNGLVTGVSAGSATFTFTEYYPICSATTLPVLVSGTTSAPTITFTTPASRCGTGIVTLGATASSGTINWFDVSTGGASLGTGTSFTTPSLSITTSYWVDATDNSLTSSPRTEIVATINSMPSAPTGNSSQSFCSGSSPTVAGLSASGTAIQWYANPSGGSALNSLTPLTNGTHYYASQTVTGCESTSRFDVTVNLTGGGIWLGTTSADWNTASNWCGGVPIASTDVVIPVGTPNQPDIGATGGLCKTLTLYCGASSGSSITGTGTLSLGGDIMVYNKGTGTDGADISCKISLGANRTLTVDDDGTSAADLTISNVISGAFGITKAGAGTMVLSGLNIYTGATNITTGTLKLGVSSALTASGPLGTGVGGTTVSSGASLDLNGFSLTGAYTEALSLNGTGVGALGALTNSSPTTSTYIGVITFATAAKIVGEAGLIAITGIPATGVTAITLGGSVGGTISTVIAGARTLTKEGSGTWTLSGASTYTGATTITAGTLKLGVASERIANTSALTVTSPGIFDLAGFSETVGSLAGSGTVTSSLTGALTLTAGGDNSNTSFSGIIQNGLATSVALTKSGSGTLTLMGTNSYSGITTVSAGTLNIQNASALGTTTSGITVSSVAALELQGGITVGAEALSLTGTGISGNGALRNISGINTYGGTITLAGTTTIQSDAGTLTLNSITGTNRALTIEGLGNGAINGAVTTGTGALTKNDSGTWTLSGNSTYSGATTINAGSIKLGAAERISSSSALTVKFPGIFDLAGFNETVASIAADGLITSSAAGNPILITAGNFSTTFSGIIENGSATSVSLTKGGTLILTLSGNSTYSGATIISAGTLSVNTIANSGEASAIGTGSTTPVISIGATGILKYTGTGHASNRVINGTANGGTIDASGSGPLSLTGGKTGAFNLVLTGTGEGIESGVIASGAGTLTKNGTGIWTLSGANTYTGATTISAGILSINTIANSGTASALGTGSTTPAISIGATGILQYTGTGHSSSRAITLSASGGTIDASGSGTLTLSGGVTGNTFGLVLTGSGNGVESGIIATTTGSVTKNGTGTWTLSGANTYTGATTIASGELRLNPTSNVTPNTQIILNGGKLSTTGITANRTITIASTLNLNANSSIDLGSNVHSITFADSHSIIWNGATLNITGWTGTAGQSNIAGGKIFFGNTTGTLDVSQLLKIKFAGYSGTPILLGTGELVPGAVVTSPALAITGITAHGSSCIGTPTAPINYTITNTGGAASGVTVISNNSHFVVSGAPTSIAGGGGTANYTVTFTPDVSGIQNAKITVASATSGSNSPTSDLTGTGNNLPSAAAGLSNQTVCGDGNVTFTVTDPGAGYTVEWSTDGNTNNDVTGLTKIKAVIVGTPITEYARISNNTTSCKSAWSSGYTGTANALPTAYTVNGSGIYCSGGSGVSVSLSGSQNGVNYQLYKDGTPTGSSVPGTGSAINFGNLPAGIYTVMATLTTGECPAPMNGSATVTVGDTTPPVITQCLPDATYGCVTSVPAGKTTYQGFYDASGRVTENCTPLANLNVSFADVIDPNSGCKLKRTYTITDASGNIATCTQIFTITDTEAPVIISVENLVVPPTNESCGAELTIKFPTAVTENCGFVEQGAHFEYNIAGTTKTGNGIINDTFPEGTTFITWTITDLCGHVSAPKTQSVQVAFSITPISYDNGSNASGAGSGVQPMQTSTHEYFVDNKSPETDYTYTWGLYVDNSGVPGAAVDPSYYSLTPVNQANVQITFKNTSSIPTGNYIISVIKTKTGIICKKPKNLSVKVVENMFDTYLNLAGPQCQAGETGTPSTIIWEVTFPGDGVAPYSLNYAVNLKDEDNNQITACSGSVSNITKTGLDHNSSCLQVEKAATDSYTVRLKYTMNSVTAKNFKVSIQIDATDQFSVSEISTSNNSETLDAKGVPNTSAITTN